jgi:hypothetical protein
LEVAYFQQLFCFQKKNSSKVLDFGLAKIELTKEAAQDAVTIARPMTREGSIMGTLQYMPAIQYVLTGEGGSRSNHFGQISGITSRRPRR